MKPKPYDPNAIIAQRIDKAKAALLAAPDPTPRVITLKDLIRTAKEMDCTLAITFTDAVFRDKKKA